jgi:hypothetical protein
MKTNRWFTKYETGSDRFGEQVSRIEFQGFDRLEDAQAFCEKNPLGVERALHGGTRPPMGVRIPRKSIPLAPHPPRTRITVGE